MQAPSSLPVIEIWPGLTPYPRAVEEMERLVAAGEERIIFCEHEPVLTIGSSGKHTDIFDAGGIPVLETGRGGQVTYHGPGQRVVYLVVNLDRFGRDVRRYVRGLQEWVVASLQEIGISSYLTDDIGVWRDGEGGPVKVAAVGVRVRRGMAYHGVSINVAVDLSVYRRFVPCGITDKGVGNIGAEGAMGEVDRALTAGIGQLLEVRRGGSGLTLYTILHMIGVSLKG